MRSVTRDAAADDADAGAAPPGNVEISYLEPLLLVRRRGVQRQEPHVAEPRAAAVPAHHDHAAPAPELHGRAPVLGPHRLEVGQPLPPARGEVEPLDHLERAVAARHHDVALAVPHGAVRGAGAGEAGAGVPGVGGGVVHLGARRVAGQRAQGAAHHVQLPLLRSPGRSVARH